MQPPAPEFFANSTSPATSATSDCQTTKLAAVAPSDSSSSSSDDSDLVQSTLSPHQHPQASSTNAPNPSTCPHWHRLQPQPQFRYTLSSVLPLSQPPLWVSNIKGPLLPCREAYYEVLGLYCRTLLVHQLLAHFACACCNLLLATRSPTDPSQAVHATHNLLRGFVSTIPLLSQLKGDDTDPGPASIATSSSAAVRTTSDGFGDFLGFTAKEKGGLDGPVCCCRPECWDWGMGGEVLFVLSLQCIGPAECVPERWPEA